MHELNIRITGKTPLDLIMGALALVGILREWHAGKFQGKPQWARLGQGYEVKTEYVPPHHE